MSDGGCTMVEVIDGIRQLLDYVAVKSLPELSARIDAVARDRDAHAKTMQELLHQFELLAVAFEQHLTRFSEQSAILSETIGRIGIRRIGANEDAPV